MAIKAIRDAFGEALQKLGEVNEKGKFHLSIRLLHL